ncbi:MAG: V-type ATP synthase subunit E [Oscillospiraceae bacterium]
MNGIENIENKIINEAKEKAAAIIASAKGEAEKIAEAAKERTSYEMTSQGERTMLLLQDISLKSQQADKMERRKRISRSKQELIEEVFQKAEEKLLSLPKNEYFALLLKLSGDAMRDNLGGELLFNKKDREIYGESVVAALNADATSGKLVTLSKDTANILGGVVIRRGKIELNCDIGVTIRILSEEMAAEVSEKLFPKGA